MTIYNSMDSILNIERLQNEICNFRKLVIENSDNKDFDKSILNILSAISLSIPYKLSGRVYRIRKIVNHETHTLKQDLWAPPCSCVKTLGRANLPGESILYTSFCIDTAIDEVRLSPGDHFSLAIYNFNENKYPNNNLFFVNNENVYDPTFTFKENTYFAILNQFLFEELTAWVKEDNNRHYNITNIIIKNILKKYKKKGVIYPSVFDSTKYNLAINENYASDILELSNVFTFEYFLKSESTYYLRLYQEGIISPITDIINYKESKEKDRILPIIFSGNVVFEPKCYIF